MANNIISPVPNNQPALDPKGMMSQIWVGFFEQLWTRAGGSNASSNTQLQTQIDSFTASPANTIKGNNTGAPSNTLNLSPAQVVAMLPVFTPVLKGLTPFSGGGTTNFLRADGAWASTNQLDYFASSQVTTTSASLTLASFVTASNSPAFTFTPAFTGKYKVYSSVPASVDGAAAGKAAVRIFNTSGGGTLISESRAMVSGTTTSAPFVASVMAQSVYTLTAGNSYVFDIQGSLIVGTSLLIDGTDSPFYMFAERVS